MMKLKHFFPILMAIAIAGCDSGTEPQSTKKGSGKTVVRPAGPQFKKEGELYLVKAAGDTVAKSTSKLPTSRVKERLVLCTVEVCQIRKACYSFLTEKSLVHSGCETH